MILVCLQSLCSGMLDKYTHVLVDVLQGLEERSWQVVLGASGRRRRFLRIVREPLERVTLLPDQLALDLLRPARFAALGPVRQPGHAQANDASNPFTRLLRHKARNARRIHPRPTGNDLVGYILSV